MTAPVKSPPRSPEVALIPHFYDDLLRWVSRPVQLSELLMSDGIITDKTAETITSNEDVQHKRKLLDAVQDSVEHRPNPEETIQQLLIALEKTGVHFYYIALMKDFIEGE